MTRVGAGWTIWTLTAVLLWNPGDLWASELGPLSIEDGREVLGPICGEAVGATTFWQPGGDVPTVGCEVCPSFTSQTDPEEGWKVISSMSGSFSEPGVEEILLLMEGCEEGFNAPGSGAAVLRRVNSTWMMTDYWPSTEAHHCVTVDRPDGGQTIACHRLMQDIDFNEGYFFTLNPGDGPRGFFMYLPNRVVDYENRIAEWLSFEAFEAGDEAPLTAKFSRSQGEVTQEYFDLGIGIVSSSDPEEMKLRFVFDGRTMAPEEEEETDDSDAPRQGERPRAEIEWPDFSSGTSQIEGDLSFLEPFMRELCDEGTLEMQQTEWFTEPVPVCTRCPGESLGSLVPRAAWAGPLRIEGETNILIQLNGCLPHYMNFAGTLSLYRVYTGHVVADFNPGVLIDRCEPVTLDGVDRLLCSETRVGQGSAETSYFLVWLQEYQNLSTTHLLSVMDGEGGCYFRDDFKSVVQGVEIVDLDGEVIVFEVEIHTVNPSTLPGPDEDPCETEGMEISTRTERRIVTRGGEAGGTWVLSEERFQEMMARREADNQKPWRIVIANDETSAHELEQAFSETFGSLDACYDALPDNATNITPKPLVAIFEEDGSLGAFSTTHGAANRFQALTTGQTLEACLRRSLAEVSIPASVGRLEVRLEPVLAFE